MRDEDCRLPQTFIRYIESYARPLLTVSHLELYVSAVESGRTTDPSLLEAQGIVARLRGQIEQIPDLVTTEWFVRYRNSDDIERGTLESLTDLTNGLDVKILAETIKRTSIKPGDDLDSWVGAIRSP